VTSSTVAAGMLARRFGRTVDLVGVRPGGGMVGASERVRFGSGLVFASGANGDFRDMIASVQPKGCSATWRVFGVD
jgi:hypothetical protein